MQIHKDFLIELQNRLKVSNRGTVYLDAIPTNTGKVKVDISKLDVIKASYSDSFINWLFDSTSSSFIIPNIHESLSKHFFDSIENLITKSIRIESEKGINTLALGFPILVKRDRKDGKLIAAPLLLWSLRISHSNNAWVVTRKPSDPIYRNEVLRNHLFNDLKIDIGEVPREFLNEESIKKEEIDQYCYSILQLINANLGLEEEHTRLNLDEVVKIPSKEDFENIFVTGSKAKIYTSGIFSVFEVQKQSIIEDYESLIATDKLFFEGGDWENLTFQPLSTVELDPTQQGVLNSIKLQKNILIQGPPGTGKSQTLTAILVNALENEQKTLVVCEKRTALEVLQKTLKKLGLAEFSVLIKDTTKDRKTVINTARQKIDNLPKNPPKKTITKTALDKFNTELQTLIDTINSRHKKLDKSIIDDKNWTELVGCLLKEFREGEIK